MSREASFLLCERCKGNIYYTRAIDQGDKWYCKHCAKALKII